MPRQIAVLALGALLIADPVASQDDDALHRWGKTTGDALVRFLPNAAPWGFSPDPYPFFSAFANETYQWKGADSLVRKYPSYEVHQTWWFDDAQLSWEMADATKATEAFQQEAATALAEFERLHGAEMKASEKAHQAEMVPLSKQAETLIQQGKYEEVGRVMEKITPFHYAPYESLTASLNKKQQELADRERNLSNRRRKVTFRVYTNRTPLTTAPKFAPKPTGTLAGHPFYRQDEGNMKAGDWDASPVDLAVFLGPPGYQNPPVKIGHRELAVKCIVVWALIESHPDTIKADEASARKVLESMDYNGLSKLIEP